MKVKVIRTPLPSTAEISKMAKRDKLIEEAAVNMSMIHGIGADRCEETIRDAVKAYGEPKPRQSETIILNVIKYP